MKILVSTAWDARYDELCNLTGANNLEYCRKHGYEYNRHYDNYKSDSLYSGTYLIFVMAMLPFYDIIVTMDADLLIMDHTKKLEDIFDTNYGQMVAEENINSDCSLINCGFVMWGSEPSTFDLLAAILREREYWEKKDPRVWQQQIWELFKKGDPLISNMKIEDSHKMNAWSTPGHKCSYKPGDFAIHPYGTPYDQKIQIIKNHIPKIKKDIKNIRGDF